MKGSPGHPSDLTNAVAGHMATESVRAMGVFRHLERHGSQLPSLAMRER